jgi:hypothetical protein
MVMNICVSQFDYCKDEIVIGIIVKYLAALYSSANDMMEGVRSLSTKAM